MLLGCEAWHKTGEILRGGLIYFRLAASSSVCGLFLLIFYMDAFLEITGVNFCCSDLLCFIYFTDLCYLQECLFLVSYPPCGLWGGVE